MSTVGSLVVNLLGNTSQFKSAFAAVPGFLGGITGRITGLLGGLGATGAIGMGVKLAANAEQMQVAFETMLGSADQAKSMLAGLSQYAMTSPFSQIATQEDAQLLLNYGIAADSILPTMRILGDIAAGDENKLGRLSLAFGQMSATGRLMGQDLNQMTSAGFNPLQEISKRTGESMGALKARMEAGAIGIDEVRQALVDATSEGGRFFGMADRQGRTLAGRYSTMRDQIDQTLKKVGQTLIETFDIKGVIESVTGQLSTFREWIAASGRDIVIVGGAVLGFVGAMVAIRTAIQAATVATAIWKAISSPAGFAMLAAGIAGATFVVAGLESMFEASANRATQLGANAREATNAIKDLGAAQNGLGGSGAGGGGPMSAAIKLLDWVQAERDKAASSGIGLSPNWAAKLDATQAQAMGRIDDLTTFTEPVDKAAEAVGVLHDRLRETQRSAETLGQAKVSQLTENLTQQIGLLSGASEKMRTLREQIAGISQIDLDATKLSQAGATNDQVEEYRQLATEAAKIKELRSAKDQLVKQLPEDVFQKKLGQLDGLLKRGLIDESEFGRGVADVGKDFAKSQYDQERDQNKADGKRAESPLQAALKGSKESGLAIARGLMGGEKDGANKKLETLAERQAKAAEKALAYLSGIKNQGADTGPELVMDF